ncbi:MAG: T9SS type A sorting domain-containing protein [Bacteroidia bacterium]
MNVQDPQVLIAKFDLNGNKIWTRAFQSLRANERCFIRLSSNNKLFFCYMEGNIYPLLADLKVGALNILDGSILTLQDAAQFRGNLGGMIVNKDNETIIQIIFNDTLYCATDTFVEENGSCILLCVDSAFNKVFSKQIPAHSNIVSWNGLSLDINENIYSTGSFIDTLIINNDTLYNPPSNFAVNGYLLSVNKHGNYRWAKQFNSNFNNHILATTTDTAGNCYTTGFFGANIAIDNIIAFGFQNEDIFVTKCDTSGNFSWIKTAGGTNDDEGWAINVSQNGKIYVGGLFKNNCTIGNTNFLSVSTTDAFIAKLSNPIVSGIDESDIKLNALSVFPNPNNGQFQWTIPVERNNENYHLEISDCIGNVIYEKDISNTHQTQILNITQLHNGLLFLEITNTQGQHFITKFIKL